MSVLHTSPKFTGFFRRLVEEKHVSAAAMQNALDAAKRAKQDTVAYLIEEVHLSPSLLAETISAEFAEPYFDLDVYDTSQIPKDLVDQKLILKHRILPLIQRGQILYVATSNPSNIEAIDAIRFNSKLLVEPVIVEHHKLEKVLGQHFAEESSLTLMMKSLILTSALMVLPLKKMKKKHLKVMKLLLLNILISCLLMPFVWARQIYILSLMKSHIGYVIVSMVCYVKLPIRLYNLQTVWHHA